MFPAPEVSADDWKLSAVWKYGGGISAAQEHLSERDAICPVDGFVRDRKLAVEAGRNERLNLLGHPLLDGHQATTTAIDLVSTIAGRGGCDTGVSAARILPETKLKKTEITAAAATSSHVLASISCGCLTSI
jgi:hypothetical protein